MSAASTGNVYKFRWLAAVRLADGLSASDKKVAEWLAANLDSATTVHRPWSRMKRELNLPDHAAGVHLTILTKAGLVGERVCTGPDQGFPLVIPSSGSAPAERKASSYETRAELEAKDARRAAARRAADVRADAKWLAK